MPKTRNNAAGNDEEYGDSNEECKRISLNVLRESNKKRISIGNQSLF